MGKASEIWKEIKPKIGEMLAAVNDIETRAEKAQDEAYQHGYETAKHECEDCPKQAYTDAIRMEGYQKGLSDAWEAARKICLNECDGGMTPTEVNKIFGVGFYRDALLEYSASEAIEKIRQYEQGEKIVKGDVVRIKSAPEVEILVTYADEEYVGGIALTEVDDSCEIGDQFTDIIIHKVEKTGRHYEIAEVLRKMKEAE